jgi:hypothetical protein
MPGLTGHDLWPRATGRGITGGDQEYAVRKLSCVDRRWPASGRTVQLL